MSIPEKNCILTSLRNNCFPPNTASSYGAFKLNTTDKGASFPMQRF